MRPTLDAALAQASNNYRVRFVVAAMKYSAPEGNRPEFWRAVADVVSSWEPDTPPTGLDARLLAACVAIPDDMLACVVGRMVAMTDDPVMVALGLEVEAARMRLREIDHEVWDAMRTHWPAVDS